MANQTELPEGHTRVRHREAYSRGYAKNLKVGKKQPPKPVVVEKQDVIPRNFLSSSFNLDFNSKKIVSASPVREYLLVQNVGTESVLVSFGHGMKSGGTGTALSEGAVLLPVGSQVSFENGICPSNDVFARTESGNAGAVVVLTGGR